MTPKLLLAKTLKVVDTHLELLNGESPAQPELCVVLCRRGTDNRTQQAVNGTWGISGGLCHACCATGLLGARLVEPCLDTLLPGLAEMAVG